MDRILRGVGGVGLALVIVCLAAFLYAAWWLDATTSRARVRADEALLASVARAADAAENFDAVDRLASRLASLGAGETEFESGPLADAVRKLRSAVDRVGNGLASVRLALKTASVLVDFADLFGLAVKSERLSAIDERTANFERRTEQLSQELADLTTELTNGGGPKTEAIRKLALDAADACELLHGSGRELVGSVEQAADSVAERLDSAVSFVRRWVIVACLLATAIAVWMGLGQYALLRNGLVEAQTP